MPDPKIAVVGGGISGLACAHRLLELSRERGTAIDLYLFEASGRLGGTIETGVHDGFVLEKGPDAFISEKPAALALAKRIGIDAKLIGTRPENRKSFVLQSGRLIPVPQGFYLIAPTDIRAFLKTPLFSLRGKLRMMLEPFLPGRRTGGDESVGSFIRRRLGRECLDRVAQAMLAGIYTGDPDKLSLECTVPRFLHLERRYGSVIRGLIAEQNQRKTVTAQASGPRYSLFMSFKEGMQTLTDALEDRLDGCQVRIHTAVRGILRDPAAGNWRVSFRNGQTRTMDAVVLATSAPVSAEILSLTDSDLSQELAAVPYESVATLNLIYRKKDVGHPLDGFGFVVPAIERSAMVAVSFSSQKFEGRAPMGCVLLRAFIGGAFGREPFKMDDERMLSEVRRELEAVLRITGAPIFVLLSRYPNAMIQYPPGYLTKVSGMRERLGRQPGLYGIGPVYGSVGIPDCIRESEDAAEKILNDLKARASR